MSGRHSRVTPIITPGLGHNSLVFLNTPLYIYWAPAISIYIPNLFTTPPNLSTNPPQLPHYTAPTLCGIKTFNLPTGETAFTGRRTIPQTHAHFTALHSHTQTRFCRPHARRTLPRCTAMLIHPVMQKLLLALTPRVPPHTTHHTRLYACFIYPLGLGHIYIHPTSFYHSSKSIEF